MDLLRGMELTYGEDFRDRHHTKFDFTTPRSKKMKDFTVSLLQVHLSLYLASSISFFALVCNRCSWDSVMLERALQKMLPCFNFKTYAGPVGVSKSYPTPIGTTNRCCNW